MTTITVGALLAGLALPVSSASAQSDPTYVRYAKVREQLIGCSLDRGWRHLSATQRRRCVRLRGRYTLYSFRGSISTSFFRCKTSRCVAPPIGVPDPRGPIPRDAVVIF